MNADLTRAAAVVPPAILATLLLSACAARSDYPSLARRPAEESAARVEGSAEPAPAATPAPVPAAPPSADFAARLDQLVRQARAAHGRFTERLAPAERAVSAGGDSAVGSEGWAAASVALGGLESARSEAMIALAELDEIYTAEAVAAAESGDSGRRDAASAAHAQVDGWVADEDAVLARLRARVRS